MRFIYVLGVINLVFFPLLFRCSLYVTRSLISPQSVVCPYSVLLYIYIICTRLLFNIHSPHPRLTVLGVVPGRTIFCRGFYASTRPLTHILRRYARLSTPAASDTQYENNAPYNAIDPLGVFCVFFLSTI